jgi:uncharacterized protein with HEPN domain
MTSPRADALRIADVLRSAERVNEVLRGGYEAFSTSWLIQSAVVRELEIIGEAAGAISGALRKRHPEVEWNLMRGFSSLAKHEYWHVDPQKLWKAVQEMPSLRERFAKIVPETV